MTVGIHYSVTTLTNSKAYANIFIMIKDKSEKKAGQQTDEVHEDLQNVEFARLEKRIRNSRIMAGVSILAATVAGTWGYHNLKQEKYVPNDNALEQPMLKALETKHASKEFQIYQGAVYLAPNAIIRENPMMINAHVNDVPLNAVDTSKLTLEDQNGPSSTDTDWGFGTFNKNEDEINLYYPLVYHDNGNIWYGFKQYIDGGYHLDWVNGKDVIKYEPDVKKNKYINYDGIPIELVGQAGFTDPTSQL